MDIDKMPEWMMDYCASIGEESFREYRSLATKYRAELTHYLERVVPQQRQNTQNPQPVPKPEGWGKSIEKRKGELIDPEKNIHLITERYKKEALKIACKFGYEYPEEAIAQFDNKITDYQKHSHEFSKVLTNEDIKTGRSTEDAKAQHAHQQYFKTNPKAKEQFETTKEDLRRLEYEEQHPDPFNHPYRPAKDERALKEKIINEKLERFLDNFNSRFEIADKGKEKGKNKEFRSKDMDDR